MQVAKGVSRDELAGSMAGGTLIMPDISTGNVGQLAADLFIATMQMERVAFFDDEAVVPVIGADVDGVIRTGLELYRGVFVLQQRAAVIGSQTAAFCDRITSWLHSSKFKVVLFLTSLPSSVRMDRQLADEQHQMSVMCSSEGSASHARVRELEWELLGGGGGGGGGGIPSLTRLWRCTR